jgi:hypothetical protein
VAWSEGMTDEDTREKLQEKLNEYLTLLRPLERAENDILLAHRMLKARTEDDLNQILPALGALSEVLRLSSVDILLADDSKAFVREAVEASGMTTDEVRHRLAAITSTAKEDLRLLGLGETI